MASPHVAGLAALVREQAPTWSVEQVRSAIRQTASDANQGQLPGFDTSMGYGRVDAEQAVLLAQAQTPLPTANLTVPKYDQRVRSKTKILGYSDVAAGATGTYRVDWSSSIGGSWNPLSSGSLVGGAAPGNVPLGVVSLSDFPQAGRYLLRLTTSDGTHGTQSVDYNEIEVCGACVAATPGAAARWKFNRAEWPNALDAAGANHGTYQGVAAPGPNGYVLDGAGFFGRPGDMMKATGVNVPAYYQLTVQAWIRPGKSFANGIIAAYRTNSVEGWEVGLASGSLYFASRVPGGAHATQGFSAGAPGYEWMHVAVVAQVTQPQALAPVLLSLYVNGQLAGTANVTGLTGTQYPAPPGAAYHVGGGQTISTILGATDWPFEGNIDEVQIFAAPLSAAQIQATYAAGCGGSC